MNDCRFQRSHRVGVNQQVASAHHGARSQQPSQMFLNLLATPPRFCYRLIDRKPLLPTTFDARAKYLLRIAGERDL